MCRKKLECGYSLKFCLIFPYQLSKDDDSIMMWAGEYQFFLRFTEKLSRLEGLIAECQRLISTWNTILIKLCLR